MVLGTRNLGQVYIHVSCELMYYTHDMCTGVPHVQRGTVLVLRYITDQCVQVPGCTHDLQVPVCTYM